MKKSILILSGCVGLLCLSLLSACSKDEEGTNPPDDGGGDNEEEVVDGDDEEDAVLTLSLDSITVDSGAGRQTVELTSNNEWEIDKPSSEWISISPSRGQAGTVTLTVDVSENQSYDRRIHVFNITAGDEEASLTVSQKQIGYLSLYTASNVFYDEGGICEVLVTTSVEYEIEYTDNGREWVSLQQTKALEEETLSFLIAEYTGDSQRECDIIFKEQGGELRDTVHIAQYHDTEVEFEDAAFERYCLEYFDEDGNSKITSHEVRDVITLYLPVLGITSLKGIEAFENIESISCSFNHLKSLDVSNCSALQKLLCEGNQLISLDVSGCPNLEELDCGINQLTSLDLSSCTVLQKLDCDRNKLTALDVSGCPDLEELDCNLNQLKILNLSGCSALQWLECFYNELTTLDASGCPALRKLYCPSNQLKSLDVSGCPALQWLDCGNNQLTSLDVNNCPILEELDCGINQLTSLDLSSCTALQKLNCDRNQLTSLDVSFCPDLSSLYCDDNPLQSMTILQEQEREHWMEDIMMLYPGIEIIVK